MKCRAVEQSGTPERRFFGPEILKKKMENEHRVIASRKIISEYLPRSVPVEVAEELNDEGAWIRLRSGVPI